MWVYDMSGNLVNLATGSEIRIKRTGNSALWNIELYILVSCVKENKVYSDFAKPKLLDSFDTETDAREALKTMGTNLGAVSTLKKYSWEVNFVKEG